jgi:cytoskeletal protein CcmA (bactofilin family)
VGPTKGLSNRIGCDNLRAIKSVRPEFYSNPITRGRPFLLPEELSPAEMNVLNGKSSMLEVKRKPNNSQSTGAATATARAYQPTLTEMQLYPVASKARQALMDCSEGISPVLVEVPTETRSYQTRIPVITGEANFKGSLPVDGLIVGEIGGNGRGLGVRQMSAAAFASQPELSGEITFRDMLRINGHIAGSVYSQRGTLIVDTYATVDSNVEVATAIISGTVRGDIVAHERVELGTNAKIYGNIWTRSISIKDGAIFDGVCTMLEQKRA